MLALEDLTTLHATCNRRIQVLLAKPSLIASLHIKASPTLWDIETRFFLRSIRNVRKLKLSTSASLTPETLCLLPSLNPVEIEFCGFPLSDSAAGIMKSYAEGSATKAERRLARLMTMILLPKFTHLTPRLETLKLVGPADPSPYNAYLAWVWSNSEHPRCNPSSFYRFPSTLTSLELGNVAHRTASLIDYLPASMVSLDLKNLVGAVSIHDITSRLPHLAHLGLWASTDVLSFLELRAFPGEALPETLSSFSVSCSDVGTFIDFMLNSRFAQSNLSSFELQLNPCPFDSRTPPIDFQLLLPPSLTKLTVNLNLSTCVPSITALPRNLLHLSVKLATPDSSFMEALTSLQHLLSLQLDAGGNRIYEFRAADLPNNVDAQNELSSTEERGPRLAMIPCGQLSRSLTHLTVRQFSYSLSKAEICALPKGLVFLSVSRFNLKWLPTLRSCLPRCLLHIEDPVEVTTLPNSQLLCVPEFGWKERSLDVQKWVHAVAVYYETQLVHFKLSLSGDSRNAYHNMKKLILDFPSKRSGAVSLKCPTLDDLAHIARTNRVLRKLVVYLPPTAGSNLNQGYFYLGNLPDTLAHLELYCPSAEVRLKTLPSSLTFLATDTHGRVSEGAPLRPISWPQNFRHFDAPNWRLPSPMLANWNLGAFEKLSLQLESIKDTEIGAFLASSNVKNPHNNIALVFHFIVSGILVPSTGPSAVTEVHMHILETLTVKALRSLHSKLFSFVAEDPPARRAGIIFLPSSTTRAIIRPTYRQWILASDIDAPGASLQPPPNLVHLDVFNLSIDPAVWKRVKFPPTLLFLRMHATYGYFESYPPHLRTLIIESYYLYHDYETPFFNVASLPPTLEHLALASHKCTLGRKDLKPKKRALNLPRLKSLLLCGMVPEAEDALLRRLRIAAIPYIHIVRPRLKRSYISIAYPDPSLLAAHSHIRISVSKPSGMQSILDEYALKIQSELNLTPGS